MPAVLLCAQLEVREEDAHGCDCERNDDCGECDEPESIVCTRGEEVGKEEVEFNERRA